MKVTAERGRLMAELEGRGDGMLSVALSFNDFVERTGTEAREKLAQNIKEVIQDDSKSW